MKSFLRKCLKCYLLQELFTLMNEEKYDLSGFFDCKCLQIFIFMTIFFFSITGLDIRWYLVSYMASRWCLDVHRINSKFMCNIAGSICCSNKTSYISKYNVNKTCKIAYSWNMGFIVCYMFSTSCWMERTKGN